MRYARILNNICVEIGDFPCDPNGTLFHPSLVWIQSNTAKEGDIYDGVNFTTPIPPITSPQPNGTAFAQDIKSNIGGILVANSLMVAYPAFFPAIQSGAWNDVQTLTIDALAKGVITPTQYGVIKNSAATYSIPITLP